MRAAFFAAAERPALPFVRAAFLAAAERLLAVCLLAALRACLESAVFETLLLPSRFKALVAARLRVAVDSDDVRAAFLSPDACAPTSF